MRIALAQMEVIPGQPDKNLDCMLEHVSNAVDSNADLIVFPEMAVAGYLLGDMWLDEAFCADLASYNDDIRNASQKIAIVWGNIYVDSNEAINQRLGNHNGWHPNKDGRCRKYNAVFVAQNGEYVRQSSRIADAGYLPDGVHPKALLPNYRIFDDERYFFSLQDIAKDFGVPFHSLVQPFEMEMAGVKRRLGFETCEDLWCNDYRANFNAINPTSDLIQNGADLIINISASPWTYGKNGARDRRVAFLKQVIGDEFVPFMYVNCVGAQNNGKNILTFDGGTSVYNHSGEPIILNQEAYQNSLTLVDESQLNQAVTRREEKPRIAQKYNALIRGLRHLKDMIGAAVDPKVVIGLSGGIDSAVNAALLVKAYGKDRVIAVNMPSQYNSNKTINCAKTVASSLDIQLVSVPIRELAELNRELLDAAYLGNIEDLPESQRTLNYENIQAKVRGTSILSNLAAQYGAIFTNNGNKLETALGYATLYGDIGGAIAPIGDLTKSEVFEMAAYLNNAVFSSPVIPGSLIPDSLYTFAEDQIAPTAELKEAQLDPMKFGYHDALLDKYTDFKKASAEQVLQWYLDGVLEEKLGISAELIKRWGIDVPEDFVNDLEWFDQKVRSSVFKRIQSPPIIITSKSAYGYDIRESQLAYRHSRHYKYLKDRVLSMKRYQCSLSV
jgi:NAD+ synthase (glutamine-hydrolysing)